MNTNCGPARPSPWHHALRMALLLCLCLCLAASPATQAARLALVIGNDQYRNVLNLKNAGNDAQLMASTLRAAGFEVVGGVRSNLDRNSLYSALEQFKARIRKDDEVVLYFAGHGVQVDATQLLLPVDIAHQSEEQVGRDAVPLHQVQSLLQGARFALLVIDACRDNPFPPRPGTRGIGNTRGMGPPPKAVEGSVVVMAAANGERALDTVPGGTASNGLFTHELVRALRTPGLDVLAAVRQTRARVLAQARAVNHAQRPSYVDELAEGEFVLFPAVAGSAGVAVAPPPARPQPGQTLRDCADCPEMVVIPAGSFVMGSPADEARRSSDEGPQHTVRVASFLAGKFEVTFAQWDACVAANGCSHQPDDRAWGRGPRPVINVSWQDAQAYVQWLGGKTGLAYRLLTEAEWEYAARAGSSTAYPWGASASHEQANYGKDECCAGLAQGRDQWEFTAPVGQFPANGFGLHDMQGNAWEWVQDHWHYNYNGAPADGAAWTNGGDPARRVLRGGSWDSTPRILGSAIRGGFAPDLRNIYTGFRIARTY